jgi:hypothetical protein
MRVTKIALVGLYAACGLLTLIFQIYMRSSACSMAGDCPLSFAKAVMWSVIWPASWVAYGRGAGWFG